MIPATTNRTCLMPGYGRRIILVVHGAGFTTCPTTQGQVENLSHEKTQSHRGFGPDAGQTSFTHVLECRRTLRVDAGGRVLGDVECPVRTARLVCIFASASWNEPGAAGSAAVPGSSAQLVQRRRANGRRLHSW